MFLHRARASLALKFILSISTLIALTSVSIGWFVIRHEAASIRNSLKNRGESLAKDLAYNSEYGVLTVNKGMLFRLVEGLAREEDVVYAVVQDKQGNVLAQIGQPIDLTYPQGALTQPCYMETGAIVDIVTPIQTKSVERIRGETGVLPGDIRRERPPAKIVREEITFLREQKPSENVEHIGIARIGLSLSRVDKMVHQITRTIDLLSLGVIAIGILMSAALVRTVVKPIRRLASVSEQVARGDFTRGVEVKSRDEIGQLANSFNKMIADLKQSRSQIEEQGRILEQRVKDRTQDLERSKEELKARVDELERWQKLTVDRELKMIELKERIKELEKQLAEKPVKSA